MSPVILRRAAPFLKRMHFNLADQSTQLRGSLNTDCLVSGNHPPTALHCAHPGFAWHRVALFMAEISKLHSRTEWGETVYAGFH
jgi:hypothetical protein